MKKMLSGAAVADQVLIDQKGNQPLMNIQRNPDTMAAPIGPFCHTSEVPGGSRREGPRIDRFVW